MGWFSKKSNDKPVGNSPSDMSPLEAVTHLCAAIQLADGQLDHEEREEWIAAVTELFPEFSEDRADNFLVEAQDIPGALEKYVADVKTGEFPAAEHIFET